jgi:hypothetical protein
LVLEATTPPPVAIIRALAQQKAEIVLMLRPCQDGWSAADWQTFFDERAGVAEFSGGLLRADAEVQAFAGCITEWLNHHPARSTAERCLGCGGCETTYDRLVPYGIESTGHAWLHGRCWPAWNRARQAEAVEALAAMGIPPNGAAR